MASARDDNAAQGPVGGPVPLKGAGHGGAGLARAEDHGAAPGRRRQVGGQDLCRLGPRHRCLQQDPQ